MSSKKAMLAAGTMSALVGVSQGAIIEMWDFEDGTVGRRINEDSNGNLGWAVWAEGVNGSHMYGYYENGPYYASSTLSTGGGVMMDVTSGQDGYADTTTDAIHTVVNEYDWSIELNVNFDTIDAWDVMIGKDRNVNGETAGDGRLADLYFQINDSGTLRLNYIDNDGERRIVDGETVITTDQWYGLAASVSTTNGTISLYVDNGDGSGYALDGFAQVTDPNMGDLAIYDDDSTWTFGRGQWNGGGDNFSDAQFDNIAFHDEAVDFTGGNTGFAAVSVSAIPEPSGVLALGCLFGASMLTRRR